jgi:hypothetical protein
MRKATHPRPSAFGGVSPDLDPPPQLPQEPHVSANALSTREKNCLWRYLKAHRPDRVLFFQDPLILQLLGQGGQPTFPLSELRAAGLEVEQARWS